MFHLQDVVQRKITNLKRKSKRSLAHASTVALFTQILTITDNAKTKQKKTEKNSI